MLRNGIGGIAAWIWRRVRAKRLVATCLYDHRLDAVRPVDPAPDCRVEILAPARMDRVLEVCAEVDLGEDRRRLAAGHICYIGLVGERAAHFSWVQLSGAHALFATGRRWKVKTGEICIYSCRTAEWARGMRLYPATLTRILNDFKAQGYSRAWIYTASDNLASRKGIERAGFRPVRKLRAIQISRFWIPLV